MSGDDRSKPSETFGRIWQDASRRLQATVERSWAKARQETRETTIFIELEGASGAKYRFRAWPQTEPSAMAGNFVVVEQTPQGIRVQLAGVTNDLSKVEMHARDADQSDKALFVRLNVARAAREQEHDDIVARYAPPKVFAAGD